MSGVRGPLAVALGLAMALSLVNVSAYQQATVTNGATLTVSHTNSAALALTSSSPQVSYTSSGQMAINFQAGSGGAARGLRTATTVSGTAVAADEVRMLNAFTVTNNGTSTKAVCVYVPGGGVPNLTAIWARGPTTSQMATGGGSALQPISLGAGQQAQIDFYWSAVTTATVGTLAIWVTAAPGGTCP